LNRATDGFESFRAEEIDEAGHWHQMGFRGSYIRGPR
jgi:hypothetical protein